jgi:hypothetical protein
MKVDVGVVISGQAPARIPDDSSRLPSYSGRHDSQ